LETEEGERVSNSINADEQQRCLKCAKPATGGMAINREDWIYHCSSHEEWAQRVFDECTMEHYSMSTGETFRTFVRSPLDVSDMSDKDTIDWFLGKVSWDEIQKTVKRMQPILDRNQNRDCGGDGSLDEKWNVYCDLKNALTTALNMKDKL